MPLRPSRPFLALALTALLAMPAVAQDRSGNAGAYLAARVAASESDYREAARWYERLIETGSTDPATLEGALIAHLGLGEMDRAGDLARQIIQKGGRSQPTFIAMMIDQTAREDYAPLIADIQAGRSVGKLIDDLVIAWSTLGDGRMSDAVGAFDAIAKAQGLEAFGLYHKALALASVGDFEGADNILSGREAGTIALMRRGAIAKHIGILTGVGTFLHSYEGLGVVEEPLTTAWARRIALAFLFPAHSETL